MLKKVRYFFGYTTFFVLVSACGGGSGEDTIPPVVIAPQDISLEAISSEGLPGNDPAITAFLNGSSAVDRVDSNLVFSQDAPSTFPLGVTTVTFSYTDQSGNTGTATSTVTIADTTPPSVTPPVDITLEATGYDGVPASNSDITAFLSDSLATDAVDSAPVLSHDAPASFPLGKTTVTFIYTDFSDNVGTSIANVTVIDTTPPVVTVPASITVEAPGGRSINAFLTGSGVIDIADPAPLLSHNAPSNFPLGITVVTFIYTDASGNTGSASASVTLVDTTPPAVTAPADIVVEAETTAGTAASNSVISAFLGASQVTDAGDPTPALSQDAPTIFPLGATSVTFTYTDNSGNIGSASANVLIVDTTPPVISLAGISSLTVLLNSNYIDAGASVFDAVSTGLPLTVSGAVDTTNVGTYTLNYDAIDNASNAATTVSRTVTVEVGAPGNVNMTISGKHLDFSWDASTAQNLYRISVNPDSASGFSVLPVASHLDTNSSGYALEIPVHLTDWSAAQYILEACNTDQTQCKSSQNLTLSQADSIPAILYLKASNPDTGDFYGSSLSLSKDGTTLAVGAPWEDSAATGVNGDQTDNSALSAGAIYVFEKSGNSWIQQAYLKASNTQRDYEFGSSVALSRDGNTLVVGSPHENGCSTGVNGNQTDTSCAGGASGAAYIFTRAGSVWSQQAYIKASNTYSQNQFGSTVSISDNGNTLAVSSPFEDGGSSGVNGNQSSGSIDTGAVYVFTRTGSTWSQQAYIKASNPDNYDLFGNMIDLSGDGNTLAVGANNEDSSAAGINGDQANNSAPDSGAVYIFTRNGTIWSQLTYIKASNTNMQDGFGFSLALNSDGNTLAVSAPYEDSRATGVNGDQADNSMSNTGAVYLFNRSGSIWSQQAYIKEAYIGIDDFGISLDLTDDGNLLAIGARAENSAAAGVGGDASDNSLSQSGAVFIFDRTANTWAPFSYVKAPTPGGGDLFGYYRSVAISGNGDTLAVGAPGEGSASAGIGGNQFDNTLNSSGAAYLY